MLEAVDRHVLDGEDRLTEVLAALLRNDSVAARTVLEQAGCDLPTGALAIDVRTQVPLDSAGSGRMDLEVLVRDAGGAIVSRLWVENKLWADFQPDQLRRYADELGRRPGHGRLVVVAPADRPAPDPLPAGLDRWLTWSEVGRRLLVSRTAPTDQRADFINYLRRRGHRVMEPIRHHHVAAVSVFAETRDAIVELCEIAAHRIRNTARYGSLEAYGGDPFAFGYTATGEATRAWGGAHDTGLEFFIDATDYWTVDRMGQPAFGAGTTLPHKRGGIGRDEVMDPARTAWRNKLANAGFHIYLPPTDNSVDIYRTKYIAELLPAGATLDQQAFVLADWVMASFEALLAMSPEPAFSAAPNESA